jgi:phosphopantothenate synthetase
MKTAYHKKVVELKKENNDMLNRLVQERGNNIALRMDLQKIQDKFDELFSNVT